MIISLSFLEMDVVIAVIAVMAVMQRGCGGTACVVKGIELDEIEGIAVELAVKQAWLVINTGC